MLKTVQHLRSLTRIKLLLKPTASTVYSMLTKGFWNIINSIPFLRNSVKRYVLPTRSHLIDSSPTYKVYTVPTNLGSLFHLSYYTRAPPSLADACPTPKVRKGKKGFLIQKVLGKVLRRKFTPGPQSMNVMFTFFA